MVWAIIADKFLGKLIVKVEKYGGKKKKIKKIKSSQWTKLIIKKKKSRIRQKKKECFPPRFSLWEKHEILNLKKLKGN